MGWLIRLDEQLTFWFVIGLLLSPLGIGIPIVTIVFIPCIVVKIVVRSFFNLL